MMHLSAALQAGSLLLAAGAFALAAPLEQYTHVSGNGIEWKTCDLSSTDQLNTTLTILCGSLRVPLDYSDPANTATIALPLLKVAAASNATKKESILLNFGGPGINGTESFQTLAAQIRAVVGPSHDLITWHPRGTDGPLLFSCYANSSERAAAAIINPRNLGNASDVQDGELWAEGEILGAACAEAQKQNGSLIGTAFTARDAMQIVDALQEDGLIRYWGFSYGTLLGSTIAAMFPDRIDKLIIDGVVNPRDYYHGLVLTSRVSSDDVLRGFAEGCVQNPDQCPIMQNRTADQIYDYVLKLIFEIKASPAVFNASSAAGSDYKIEYSGFKALVYSLLYSPEDWSGLADIINAVAIRDTTLVSNVLAAESTSPPEEDDEAFIGIQCSDTFARANTLQDAISYLKPFRNNEFADVDDSNGLTCARWPFAAKERYSGDFQVKTRNPILVIGNTWDPATPFISAQNVSLGFEGSVLLQQRGYGHTSIAQASLCTSKRIRDYFNHGILPQIGTICAVDEPFFPADSGVSSWADVLEKLAETNDNGTVVCDEAK